MLQQMKSEQWLYVRLHETLTLKIEHLVVRTDIVFIQDVSNQIEVTIVQERSWIFWFDSDAREISEFEQENQKKHSGSWEK